ncbi:MAG: AAA family ATPase [Candidatus Paceibacterota bacterium]
MDIKVNGIKALNGKHLDMKLGDLMVFYGGNSCGKSSIIIGAVQYFILGGRESGIIADYISPQRFNTTDEINADRFGHTEDQNTTPRLSFGNGGEIPGPDPIIELSRQDPETLERILVWFNSVFEEIQITKEELNRFSSRPKVTIGGHAPRLQGTGTIAVLSIIIQLFNPLIKVLAIDEPELSLEPRMQKKLFELIKEAAFGRNGVPRKKVLIATHSHLFMDRDIILNNYQVTKVEGQIAIKQITTQEELNEGIYNLLGSSPTDLHFPGNIVVVEGRSDSVFLRGVLGEMVKTGICNNRSIVFHFLDGYDEALTGTKAVVQMLKTQAYVPVYLKLICGIFDNPAQNKGLIDEIRDFMGDADASRFILLEKPAIEFYYPVEIISEIFKKPLTVEQYESEVVIFLDYAKSHRGVGVMFGQKISKVELASNVVSSFAKYGISKIDKQIIELLSLSVNLAFK